MLQNGPDLTPERLQDMREFGRHAATLFQRHSAGAGGMVRALGEDVLALVAAYEAAARERDFAKARLDAVVRAVAGVNVAGGEQPDAAG